MTIPCQRWRLGRSSYRVPDTTIDPRCYEVAPIPDDSTPRAFVELHHYSGTYPAARWRFGLYRSADLVGVAVFSVPCNSRALTNHFDVADANDATELGRFVLLDDVPANGETWFLARCLRPLRRDGVAGVIAFSDPMPRHDADGAKVFRGHIGTIYQASNAHYCGRATPRTLRLLPDGSVFSDRAAQKIRSGNRGWRYAVEQLREAGAPPLSGDRRQWLTDALASVTRRVRHPGNHRYGWALRRSAWRDDHRKLDYPKGLERALL